MTREEQLKAITLKVGATRFGGNEYANFDFVMIGDVLDLLENDFVNVSHGLLMDFDLLYIHKSTINLFNIWKEKRKPLEKQSDECIDYIYNLIKYE